MVDRIRGDYSNHLRTYQKNLNKLDKTKETDQADKKQTSNAKKKDSLELTGISREIKAARTKITELDREQEARVENLKDTISQGKYNVSGQEIADKMIRDAQFDRNV